MSLQVFSSLKVYFDFKKNQKSPYLVNQTKLYNPIEFAS